MEPFSFDYQFGTGIEANVLDTGDELVTITRRGKRIDGKFTKLPAEPIQPDPSVPPTERFCVRYEFIENGRRQSHTTIHPVAELSAEGGPRRIANKIVQRELDFTAKDEAEFLTLLQCTGDPLNAHRVVTRESKHWSDPSGLFYDGVRTTTEPVEAFSMSRSGDAVDYSVRLKLADGTVAYADVQGDPLTGLLPTSFVIGGQTVTVLDPVRAVLALTSAYETLPESARAEMLAHRDNQLRAQLVEKIDKVLRETIPGTPEGHRRRAELEAQRKELNRK